MRIISDVNRLLFAALALCLMSSLSFAATYTLPAVNTTSGPFAGCGVFGNVIQCNSANLVFGNNDELVLTQNVIVQVGANFTAGNNFKVNVAGTFSLLFQVGGNVSIGNGSQMYADLVGGANITFDNNAVVVGDVTAGATLNFGNGSGVTGSCSGTNPTDYAPYCGAGNPVLDFNYCENFEAGLPADWTITGRGEAGTNSDTASSGTQSLFLRNRQVVVTTQSFNIASDDEVLLTAWIRRGGSFSELPDNGENLQVEYLNASGSWNTVATYLGGGTPGEIFNLSVIFSGTQLHNKFQLRWNKVNGSNGDYDYWHIDDVCLTPQVSIPAPVLEYRFDEATWNGTAGEVIDSSTTAAHGTGRAGISPSVDGAICNAASFNGVDQYIESPGLGPLRTSSTLSFWIKTPNGYSGSGTPWTAPVVTGYEQSGGRNDIFWGYIDGNGRISLSKGDTTSAGSTRASYINDNTYHHVALSWDSVSGAANIYIDGLLDHSYTTETGDVTYLFRWIGLIEDSGGSLVFLNGLIDEFIVFNEVLNAVEIEEIYTLQANGQNLDGSVRSCTPPKPSVCFTDDYQRATLGSDWAVSSRSGAFGDPRIVNNRLRINDNSGNVSTAATLFRLFPSAGNKIVVEFDYFAYGDPTDGGDGLALVFSDANEVPQPGGYGGSLGYAQKDTISGFAGGWMAVGFDEYGNFLNRTDGNKSGGFTTRVRETITIRGSGAGTTGYNYITSNGQTPGSGVLPSTLSPGVETSTGHRYRVTIDHENGTNAFVTIERDTGTGFVDIVSTFDLLAQSGQAAIPQKMYLTLTGSTGGATNAHEIDNLEVCANTIEPAYYIDHYELDRDYDEGLTCEPLNIAARACLNADCSTQISDPVDTTFAPVTGWAGSNIKSGYSSGDSFAFQQTTAGTYTLGVIDSLPALKPLTTDPVQCYVSGARQPDCDVDFVDVAYRFFSTAAPTTSVARFSMTAGQPLPNILMRAIKTDEATGQCQAFLANSATLASNIGTTCSNPATCAAGQQVTWQQAATATSLANPENQVAGNNTATLGVTFSANSTASGIALTAPDIGTQQLTVTTPNVPDVDGNPSALTITGSVVLQVSPASLAITSVKNTLNTDNDGVTKFAKAGELFTTTLQALDANSNPVASFGRVAGLYDIDWSTTTLIGPTGGTLGALAGDGPNLSSAAQWQGEDSDSNGSLDTIVMGSGNGVSYSEVGNINLRARINDFMGFGTSITSNAVNVGRFTPAYLQVTEVNANTAQWGNTGSVYQGQSNSLSGLSYDVMAYDVNGNSLTNYVGIYVDFPNRTGALEKPTTLSATGGALSNTLDWTVSNDTDFDGTIRLTAVVNDINWTRNSAGPNANDTIKTVPTLQLAASAMTDIDDICVQLNASGTCQTVIADIADRTLYYARLLMPEQVDAGSDAAFIPLTLEYLANFSGGEASFAIQTAESALDGTTLAGLDYTGGACSIAGCPGDSNGVADLADNSLTDRGGLGATLSNGLGLFSINSPVSLQGVLQVDADIPDWLTWYWQGDANGNGILENSELAATSTYLLFGDYQGRSPILFQRPGFR